MLLGILFVVIGLSLIFNKLFQFQIPIFQVCFGIGLIYLGINWLFGSFKIELKPKVTDSAAILGKGQFVKPNTKDNEHAPFKYDVVLGSGAIDLRGVDLSRKDVSVKINTVLGESIVLIDDQTPFEVQANTVLGNSEIPLQNKTYLGTLNYKSKNYDTSPYALRIDTDVVLGSFKITTNPADLETTPKAAAPVSEL